MRWLFLLTLFIHTLASAADSTGVTTIKAALETAIKAGQTPGAVLWMARGRMHMKLHSHG